MSRELDARVAEAMGYRFWLEQRGEYRLAVNAKPGEREPWKGQREEYQQPERYTPCTAVQAQKAGWFGRETPRFSTDPAACEELRKECRRRGWCYEEAWYAAADGSDAEFWTWVNDFDIHHISEVSQEEAFCLAFLAAVEAVEAEKGAKQ